MKLQSKCWLDYSNTQPMCNVMHFLPQTEFEDTGTRESKNTD